MNSITEGIRSLLVTLVASIILIVLGVIYFMFTVWIIKVGASWAGYSAVDGATVVLTAGIVTAASMIGSSIQR